MDALRQREIGVGSEIGSDFLLVGDVGRVDARVLVILAEDANASKAGEGVGPAGGSAWRRCKRSRPSRAASEIRGGKDRTLLSAIGRDRANLRKHVLVAIVDAIAT